MKPKLKGIKSILTKPWLSLLVFVSKEEGQSVLCEGLKVFKPTRLIHVNVNTYT